ncbi:hypothetical protein M2271_007398 [Streptomyces sp. LBL]|nr:hypothetical protein [Streptomyces sp. LBL]
MPRYPGLDPDKAPDHPAPEQGLSGIDLERVELKAA